jgi:cell wall-associated NlpC family hydrolase
VACRVTAAARGTLAHVAVISGAQVAALVKAAGFPESVHVIMVAISKAESGWNTTAINTANSNGSVDRGLFQVNSIHGFDANRLLNDAQYNTECAKNIYDRQGLGAWSVYNSGAWQKYEAEARQAVAQSDNVAGSPVLAGGGSSGTTTPAVTYGPPGPEFTNAGVGTPLVAAEETGNPLAGLKIVGSDLQGDYSAVVIGAPAFEAGIETIPNLKFTLADPEGDILWRQANVFERGAHVTYQDLDLRVDTVTFEPGSHTTGQLVVTCVDDIVWSLSNVRGARTASGISATEWIVQELQTAGIDPDEWFLGESVPTQSEIARDAEDQAGQASSANAPSAWTTIVRLARELGKRVFVSGRRLVFGSSEFAMRWTAPGDLRLSWHGLSESERFLTLPTCTTTAIGDRERVVQVSGKVPLGRAKYFRPGCPVIIRQVPAIAAGEWQQFMVTKVAFDLGTDTDGADIELMEPVDPPPQPPTSSASLNGGSTSSGSSETGGGTDGQIDRFVALALQQAGDSYVYGATPAGGDADPRAFDCSSLVQWAAGRVGISGVPRTTDTQEAHCRANGTLISVADGIGLKGALLFHPNHVAISLGNGRTIEAMNDQAGVLQANANGRGWTVAGKLPGAQGYR